MTLSRWLLLIVIICSSALLLVSCNGVNNDAGSQPLDNPVAFSPIEFPPTEQGRSPATPIIEAATPTESPTIAPTITLNPDRVDNPPAGDDLATKVVRPTAAADGCKNCEDGANNGGANNGDANDGGAAGTPQPTVTPTPTTVPSLANAPRFPETPIVDQFDPVQFVLHLGLVRDSFRSFSENWVPILLGERARGVGDCGSYLGWYTLWVTQVPVYNAVPETWFDLYYELRLMLEGAVSETTRIRQLCPGVYPGPYSLRDRDPIGFFAVAYPRAETMVVEGLQRLP